MSKGPEERFFPRRLTNCQQVIKMCSTSLIIREMQSNTTVRYHLSPVRMAIIKKTTKNKFWWGYKEKGILVHCCWDYKSVQPLWKTIWMFLKNLRRTTIWSSNSTSGYTSKENENTNWKWYLHPNVHGSIIYNSQNMEAI